MKRFSALIYLPLFASVLFSCEKELVEPSLDVTAVADASASCCNEYTYYNKLAGGTTELGTASDDMILVGFTEGLSLKARQRILGRYPLFHSITGELASETGTITLVKLHAGGSCYETEKLLGRLLRESQIKFAYPFFENDTPDAEQLGLSNEFVVLLEETATLSQLKRLVAATNTTLAISYDQQFHLITADKNSMGHILQIISKFNQQSFVTVAEPNLVYSLPAAPTEVQNYKTAKGLKKGSFKLMKEKKQKEK